MNRSGAFRISLYLILFTHLVFLPVVTYPFIVYDDAPYVYENPMVRSGLSASSFRWAWTTFRNANWHPLTWLSHMLDWQMYGNLPGLHHYSSLVLHLANTVGLFLVLRRLTGVEWRSALVAALFAVHPLHVESVAWVAERKDVLSAFFGILALGAYAVYCERPGILRYLGVMVAFILGLLAKPMLVTWPFVFLLLDYWPLGRFGVRSLSREQEVGGSRCTRQPPHPQPLSPEAGERGEDRPSPARWLLLEKVPFLMVSAASCVVTVIAQRAGGAVASEEDLPLKWRLANALVAYVSYLRKMVWPADLAILYPHPLDQLPAWQVVASGLVLLLVTMLVVVLRRRCPYLLVGWLWYLGTLVPVIGLVQVGVQAMADRYTYIPLIGIFLALAWAIPSALLERRWGRVGVAVTAGGVLAACAVSTFLYLRCWRDDRAVWERALHVNPNNAVAHHNLGIRLYREGKVDEAEAEFIKALRLRPNFALPMNNLGICLWRAGRLDQAVALLCRAVQVGPQEVVAHDGLGIALFQQGKMAAACRCFRQAVQMAPEVAEYHYNLATALEEGGNHEEAGREYQQALRLDPGWPQKADQMARELLDLNRPKMRWPPEALFRAKQACQATGNQRPAMLDTLAAAYAATGKLADAVATERKAGELAESTGPPELVQDIRDKLHLYEADLEKQKHSG